MKKLFSFIFIMSLIFSLCACSFSANKTENSNTAKPVDCTNDPTTPDESTPLPPEKTEIEITEDQILKYYDYFTNTAPGFTQISFAIGGDFGELSFDSAADISDEELIFYALVNLLSKGLYEHDKDGYVLWKKDAVISEIERGFAGRSVDFEGSDLVDEIPEDGALRSTGWGSSEGFSPKLIQLTQSQDGTYIAIFYFYGVFDYLLEVGPFDVREEIIKDHSDILNSKYCNKITKTITFIEQQSDGEIYLQFISMQ